MDGDVFDQEWTGMDMNRMDGNGEGEFLVAKELSSRVAPSRYASEMFDCFC